MEQSFLGEVAAICYGRLPPFIQGGSRGTLPTTLQQIHDGGGLEPPPAASHTGFCHRNRVAPPLQRLCLGLCPRNAPITGWNRRRGTIGLKPPDCIVGMNHRPAAGPIGMALTENTGLFVETITLRINRSQRG
jgi:hypothetical protein